MQLVPQCKKRLSKTHRCRRGSLPISKCVAFFSKPAVLAALPPLQLRVSVKGGCDAIIQCTCHFFSPFNHTLLLLALLVNCHSVFNNINQELMFQEIRHHIPFLSAWIECCYSTLSHLQYGQYTIMSCCNKVQQGNCTLPVSHKVSILD